MILPHSFLLSSRQKIWSIIRNEDPDLIEICDKFSLPGIAGLFRKGWAHGLRRPALVGLSCERMDDGLRAYLKGHPLGIHFSRWYLGQIYIPQFDFHLANSEYTKAELLASVVARHARKIAVCPVGVDSDLFTPARRSETLGRELRKDLGLERETVLLLYAGRISPEKNILLLPGLMRALSRDASRRFVLLVAGSGPALPLLQRACRELPSHSIRILGHIPDRTSLADLFANCDVFIHPNPREPFGIAPLEAMASGLPLVAPNSGGLLSYANEQNAWLTMPNAEAFAWKVRNILNDPVTRERRVRMARKTAEKHSWETVTDQIFRLYDEVCSGGTAEINSRQKPEQEVLENTLMLSRS